MKSIVRFGAVVAMAAAMVVGFAGSASADEEFGLHAEAHVRACPSDVENWFEDCHDNPVADFEFTVYEFEDECTTGDDGNCAFVSTNNYGYIYWMAPVDYVYCSVEDEESGAAEIEIVGGEGEVYFPHDLEHSSYVCDLYIIDDSLVPDDGAALPNTGAGVSGQGANLGLLLAGVVALGGLAVASRRAAVR